MHLMYVDESGDPGMVNSPTRYFVLSGLVIHELSWLATLDSLIEFRRRMRERFGLKLREEIHAAHFVRGTDALSRIAKHDRLAILRYFSDELAALPGMTAINVVVDKQGKATTYDPFEKSWQALIQRFENTIGYRNFRGPASADDRGMIFPDGEPIKKLGQLLRRMRRHNPVPSQMGGYRSLQLQKVVEDPVYRDSRHSLMIQAADLCAYLLYQRLAPNGYMRRKGGAKYFDRLSPMLCRAASSSDPDGIVRL
ncbi:MAG: DUF3800 domain-containing protein [Arenimonas sp.]|nr:DUF3800 domain-containing protein [Arenimonas sp.]